MNAVDMRLIENADLSQLIGKKIGYYTGSFDPIHLGHQRIIDQVKQIVDYVIVSPVMANDSFKNRTDVAIRREMIGALYKDEPKVLLTHLSPIKLQELLGPYFGKLTIVGVIGSDVVLDNQNHHDGDYRQKVEKIFMRGLPIPEKHAENGVGAIMALPVTSFIISIRDQDDLSKQSQVFGRPIEVFLNQRPNDLSSTKVREAARANGSIDEMVDSRVQAVMKRYGLYLESQK